MFLNDDIVDIEKPDGICLPLFVVDEFKDYLHMHELLLLNIQDLYK